MKLRFDPSGVVVELPDAVQPLCEQFASVMMDANELLHLAATLVAYPPNQEAIVVEIGSYIGMTTVFMAKVLKLLGRQTPILSIDPFERVQPDALNPQGVYSAYVQNTAAHGVASVCLPLAAFSQDAAPVVPATAGVLVVDGGHHYPVVSDDLKLYIPKVRSKGLVFIDDYGPAYPDVMRAVDEYFTGSRSFGILHKSHFVIAQRLR
jgi:hypothetical protein